MARDAKDPIVLYGPDDRPLPPELFRTPVDVGPSSPIPGVLPPRVPPQSWAYGLAVNRVTTIRTDEGRIPYAKLRALGRYADVIRTAIEFVKDRTLAPKVEFVARGGVRSKQARAAVQPQVERATTFWRRPDRINRLSLRAWLHGVLEEVLVCDGLRAYKHRARDGSLHSLRLIDADTLKPILDAWGTRLGWQQIVRGLPRVNFPDADFLSTPYSYRVSSAYGTSHLEDILATVETWIRKGAFDLGRFTDSNVPRGFLYTNDNWTVEQAMEYQTWVDQKAKNDPTFALRFIVLPGGRHAYQPVLPLEFDKDMHEALISMVCARFKVSRSLFVSEVNRAGAETAAVELAEPGIVAMQQYLEGEVFDPINAEELDAPDVAVRWTISREKDRLAVAQERQVYVTIGAILPEEVREELGFDPFEETKGLQAVEIEQWIFTPPGVVTVDEARLALGMPPLGPPIGDMRLVAGGPTGPEDEAEEGEDEPEDDEAEGKAEGEGGAPKDDDEGGPEEPKDAARRAALRRAGALLDLVGERRASFRSAVGDPHVRQAALVVLAALPGPRERLRGRLERTLRTFGDRRMLVDLYVAAPAPSVTRKHREAWTDAARAREEAVVRRAAARLFERSLGGALEAAVAEVARRRADASVEGRVEDPTTTRDAAELLDGDAIDEFLETVSASFGRIFGAAGRDAAAEFGRRGEHISRAWFDANARAYGAREAGRLITRINGTTEDVVRFYVGKAVEEAWTDDELSDAIEQLGFSDSRADTIARTEVATAQNVGQVRTWRALGGRRVHVFDGDGDEECARADGQIWTLEQAEANPLAHPNCTRSYGPIDPSVETDVIDE